MEYRIVQHAKDQMLAREIRESVLDAVLQAPDQVIPGKRARQIYQSIIELRGKRFLLRAVVEPRMRRSIIVSVYLTSDINRYWRSEES